MKYFKLKECCISLVFKISHGFQRKNVIWWPDNYVAALEAQPGSVSSQLGLGYTLKWGLKMVKPPPPPKIDYIF